MFTFRTVTSLSLILNTDEEVALQYISVLPGSSGALERVTSAGPVGRNKPKGTPIRALHPNSSPVYKTQSETSLTAGFRNLTVKDKSTARRVFTTKASGTSKVKNLTDAANLLQTGTAQNVVIVAGAGISTPSGIPDFRSPGTGLYDNLQQYQIPYPEAIFDIDYFHVNPRPFFTLAKELYPSGKYRPNYIHYFARMLNDKGQLLRMYTQNIDGLERLAGVPAEKLVEAHGTFATATCTICRVKLEGEQIKEKIFADKLPRCPKQGCVGIVKPDIVFFGEDLPRKFYNYMKDMLQADMVLVMGTSLEVQPFAGIIDTVRMNVPRILFNREAVGPFRFNRRTQDVVAAGDLVDNMVKFSTMIGWKEDMVQLITKEEGEFKILNKSPPKPPGNQTRNYSSLAYRYQGAMCSDSSTEEDSESETSSDSSVEENKNSRYRSTNRRKVTNSYQRNGASNRLNGFRASSAKLDPKRRLHTEANGENSGKNLVGNMTGRSVKSESGINHDVGKRQIENKSTGQKSNGLGNFVKKSEPKENVTKAERERVLRKYGLSPHPKYKAPTTVNNKTNDQTAQKNKVAIPETIYMGQKQNIDTHATQEKEPEVLHIANSAEKVNEIDMVSEEKRVEDIPESPLPTQGEIDLNLRKDKSIVSGYFINDVSTIPKEGLQREEQTPRMTNMTVTIKKKEKHKGPSSVLSGSSNLSSDSKVLKSLSDKTAQSFAKYASLSMQRRVVGHNLQTKPPSMPKRNETIQQEIGILNPRPYGFANRFKKTSTGVVPQKQSQAPVLNRSVQYSDIISINAPSTTDLPRITYRHKMTPPVNAYDARVFGPRPGVEMSSDDCNTSDDSR